MAAQTEKAQDWHQASEAIALKAAKAAQSEMAEHGERDPILKHIVDDPEKFAHSLAKIVEQGGRALAAYLERFQRGEQKDFSADFTEFAKTLSKVGQYWLSDPARTFEAQSRWWVSFMNLQAAMLKRASGEPWEPVASPDPRDKRFVDPEWTENQFFDFLKQAYLLSTQWAEAMVDEAEDLDEHTRQKAAFYVRQLTNALSPSNFVLTNPELLRETAAESGENLARGMKTLADDIERGGGELRLRHTPLDTFEVGENIALTPGKVIAQNDVRQLIQYEAQTDEVAKAPLLIIPPWINKFYILDLNPEKSLIKWLVEQGRTVFVVSWINPDAAHAEKDFVSYMREGILDSLDVVQRVTGEDKIDVVGYCVGGTLLGMTLPYLKATGDDRINSATFLTTQVDFTYAGDLKVFVDKDQLDDLEKRMEASGYLDGSHMANAFNMLRSNELIWPYVVNNYIRGKDPFPFDLLYWNSDSTRMPCANHLYYLRNFYLENRLAKGTLEVDGHKLSLSDVTVPVFNVATRDDHIAPAKSVFIGNQLFGGDAHFVLGGSGHIAGIVNPPSRTKYQYWTDGPNEGTFEDWMAGASEHHGSWWPHWLAWLEAHSSGDPVPGRPVGGGGFAPIEDAPGSYVKVRF